MVKAIWNRNKKEKSVFEAAMEGIPKPEAEEEEQPEAPATPKDPGQLYPSEALICQLLIELLARQDKIIEQQQQQLSILSNSDKIDKVITLIEELIQGVKE
jgi:hypothetical protein